jgi:hypothetical protein
MRGWTGGLKTPHLKTSMSRNITQGLGTGQINNNNNNNNNNKINHYYCHPHHGRSKVVPAFNSTPRHEDI